VWSLKYIGTLQTGEILSLESCNDIVDDFTMERTLGDEFWVKSSDLNIKHRQTLPWYSIGGPSYWWLGVFWNDELIDAFRLTRAYDKEDEKRTGHYETRLKSIQKSLYDDLNDTVLDVVSDINSWNNNISVAAVRIKKIRYKNNLGNWSGNLNNYGFSLGALLHSINGSEYKGYRIHNWPEYPGPMLNEDHCIILFRGSSIYYYTEAVEFTFTDYGITWMDLFKLAAFAFNCFISVKPIIQDIDGTDYLTTDINLLPRINITLGSTKSPDWTERKKEKNKYQIDGVHLFSAINDEDGDPSFSYEQGDIEGDNVFEKSVDIADPTVILGSSVYNDIFYWCDCIYDEGENKYDILDDEDEPMPYFASGLVEEWYQDMIDTGDGYEGNILFDGEDAGDHLVAGDDVIQASRVQTKKNGISKASGTTIAQ